MRRNTAVALREETNPDLPERAVEAAVLLRSQVGNTNVYSFNPTAGDPETHPGTG